MDTVSSGFPPLDDVLGGVFWGDNVVWETVDDETLRPFMTRVADHRDAYDAASWVRFADDGPVPEGFAVLDARVSGPLHTPGALLDALRRSCGAKPRHLVVVDALTEAVARWGEDTASRFFVHACPMLLGIGSVAHWRVPVSRSTAGLRRAIREVTQVVLSVGDGIVRIDKAEGRPPGVEGLVFRYHVDETGPVMRAAPASARLGAGLRAVRRERRLSQAALAELAGVTASAVSQAERGERGLSLETLLAMSGRLGLSLDELLRGEVRAGYRLARRDDPRRDAVDQPVLLLDGRGSGVSLYVVRLSPGATAEPGFASKGAEIVAVAQGLVQVGLASGRPVLRHGEALLADASGVESWRNLTDREALVFWILTTPAG